MQHHFKWEIMKISSDVNKKYVYIHTYIQEADHHSTLTVEILISHMVSFPFLKRTVFFFFAKVCV